MLLSMTGHGEARRHDQELVVHADVRSINNKYFKLILRAPDEHLALESQIETTVRESIRRGTVHVTLRVERPSSADDFRLNEVVLASYRRQLEAIEQHQLSREPVRWDSLLSLPGIVTQTVTSSARSEQEWPIIRAAIDDALIALSRMRADEGQNMAADLRKNLAQLNGLLAEVDARSPLVVESYRQRFEERLRQWLTQFDLKIQTADLLREVGLFSERCDIREEIVRLKSHLEQFESYLSSAESSGRKLDFLTQEMFRETNTIGAKANDAVIARSVIEMKSLIERIREMIQNVE